MPFFCSSRQGNSLSSAVLLPVQWAVPPALPTPAPKVFSWPSARQLGGPVAGYGLWNLSDPARVNCCDCDVRFDESLRIVMLLVVVVVLLLRMEGGFESARFGGRTGTWVPQLKSLAICEKEYLAHVEMGVLRGGAQPPPRGGPGQRLTQGLCSGSAWVLAAGQSLVLLSTVSGLFIVSAWFQEAAKCWGCSSRVFGVLPCSVRWCVRGGWGGGRTSGCPGASETKN